MAKSGFVKELRKIFNQGVIYENRCGGSFVYALDVNLDGNFAVRKWAYWNGACHGRRPVEEWAYETADEALAKFEEIKKLPGAKHSVYEKLTYVD